MFSGLELNQLADTMGERGIRMRIGLDELVGDVEDNRGEAGEDEEDETEDEDEIEYNAREKRRLMPY